MAQVTGEVFFTAVQETLGLGVCRAERQQVHSCELGLLARRHKDNHRELGGVLADGVVDGLHHGDEAGRGVGDGEALDVQLQGNRPHVGVETEEAMGGGSQPLAQVLGVGHRRTQGHDADLTLDLGRDVAHARAHDLKHRLCVCVHSKKKWAQYRSQSILLCSKIELHMLAMQACNKLEMSYFQRLLFLL